MPRPISRIWPPFLRRGVARNLRGATLTAYGSHSKWLDAQECQRLVRKPPRSISQSPQKRSMADDYLYNVGMPSDTASEGLSRHKCYRHSFTEHEKDSGSIQRPADQASFIQDESRSTTAGDIANPEYTNVMATKTPLPCETPEAVPNLGI